MPNTIPVSLLSRSISEALPPQRRGLPGTFSGYSKSLRNCGRGGQKEHMCACDTKKNCDAIYAYYDALKALAGPYVYQSPSGTVVAQLNSGLTPDEAKKFEQAIKSLP